MNEKLFGKRPAPEQNTSVALDLQEILTQLGFADRIPLFEEEEIKDLATARLIFQPHLVASCPASLNLKAGHFVKLCAALGTAVPPPAAAIVSPAASPSQN